MYWFRIVFQSFKGSGVLKFRTGDFGNVYTGLEKFFNHLKAQEFSNFVQMTLGMCVLV